MQAGGMILAPEDDLDELYWRANKHAPGFVGLTERQAAELAQKLGLTLEVVPADAWHAGVNVSGRVTLFGQDGIVTTAH
jgi:hypothetical protein